MKRLCIFGAGGAAKDAYSILFASGLNEVFDCFIESDDIWKQRNIKEFEVKPLSTFNPEKQQIIIAIGDSVARKTIAEILPIETEYYTLIHPQAIISPFVELGKGCIISAGCILTIDIKIGNHAYINIATTISHDCRIGDFFTSAPSVNISGNCKIGNCVYLGTNASLREKLTIADNVTIGMGGMVVKSIDEPGTYIGVPVKKIS
jgi:sugar O-acyltransferase (sialic acid O-acetyltransferase NeuD family)